MSAQRNIGTVPKNWGIFGVVPLKLGASPPNSPYHTYYNTSEAHLLPSYHTLLLIIANTDTDLLIV